MYTLYQTNISFYRIFVIGILSIEIAQKTGIHKSVNVVCPFLRQTVFIRRVCHAPGRRAKTCGYRSVTTFFAGDHEISGDFNKVHRDGKITHWYFFIETLIQIKWSSLLSLLPSSWLLPLLLLLQPSSVPRMLCRVHRRWEWRKWTLLCLQLERRFPWLWLSTMKKI